MMATKHASRQGYAEVFEREPFAELLRSQWHEERQRLGKAPALATDCRPSLGRAVLEEACCLRSADPCSSTASSRSGLKGDYF